MYVYGIWSFKEIEFAEVSMERAELWEIAELGLSELGLLFEMSVAFRDNCFSFRLLLSCSRSSSFNASSSLLSIFSSCTPHPDPKRKVRYC